MTAISVAKELRLWLLLLLAIAAGLYAWNAVSDLRSARQALLREQEARKVDQEGFTRVLAVQKVVIERQAALAAGQEESLRQEIARLQKLHKDAKPTRVVRASTGPIPVTSAVPDSPSTPRGGVEEKPCKVKEGDNVRIDVAVVDMKLKYGTTVVTGSATLLRLDPPDKPGDPPKEVRLLGQKFDAEVTKVYELAVKKKERKNQFLVGPLVGVGSGGAAIGLTLTTPRANLPIIGETAVQAVGIATQSGHWAALAGPVVSAF